MPESHGARKVAVQKTDEKPVSPKREDKKQAKPGPPNG
jgi:hypothetical protein